MQGSIFCAAQGFAAPNLVTFNAAALIQSGAVLNFWDAVPNPLALPNGDVAHCAAVGYDDGTYQIWPAGYTDVVPPYPSTVLKVATRVNGTSVLLARTWAVPQTVTKGQACMALYLTPSLVNQGKTMLDDVNAAVTAAGGVTALWWQYATSIDYGSDSVNLIGTALGLSQTQIAALFMLAAQQSG